MHSDALKARIDRLLHTRLQGVLATQQQARPYTSLMAFAHTPDLRYLTFATLRDTRKHANLLVNSAVSFLVDDRSNDPVDYQRAVAISACGCAQEVPDSERERFLALFLGKHPSLRDFVGSPDCALLRVTVSGYRVVSQFQEVELLPIDPPG